MKGPHRARPPSSLSVDIAGETERHPDEGQCSATGRLSVALVSLCFEDLRQTWLSRVRPRWLPAPAPEPIPQDWRSRPGALLLVCGGREYTDSAYLFAVLDGLKPCAVVHGACGVDADRPRWARMFGADRLADAWCTLRPVPAGSVPGVAYPAHLW